MQPCTISFLLTTPKIENTIRSRKSQEVQCVTVYVRSIVILCGPVRVKQLDQSNQIFYILVLKLLSLSLFMKHMRVSTRARQLMMSQRCGTLHGTETNYLLRASKSAHRWMEVVWGGGRDGCEPVSLCAIFPLERFLISRYTDDGHFQPRSNLRFGSLNIRLRQIRIE